MGPASEYIRRSGADRTLPVLAELAALLPWAGLRRGATVAVRSGRPGSTSLLTALLAGPSGDGAWVAAVGLPALGVVAAAEAGVRLERLALVPDPGAEWATVTAGLLDGFDIVLVNVPDVGAVTSSQARRLMARARQRGSVLVPFGVWAGADLTLEATHVRWHGLDQGHGRFRGCELTVSAHGRGAATRPRTVRLVRPEGLSPAPLQPVPARLVPARPGPARPVPARPGPARLGPDAEPVLLAV